MSSTPSMQTPLPDIPTLLQSNNTQQHQSTTTSSTSTSTSTSLPDTSKYGTHEVTCDGCNSKPIVGYRWKCTKCRDHDICDQCHEVFTTQNKLLHVNKLNPNVPRDASAHSFEAVAEGNSFTRIGGASKPQPTVKKQSKKPGPNESCHCGSGKKYKKCHMLQDQKFNQ